MFGFATKRELADMELKIRAVRRMIIDTQELLQERHDAVIELIAQIAEAKVEVKGAPKQKRKKAT